MFNFRAEFYKRYGNDYELASLELGKSSRTLQRYFSTNKCEIKSEKTNCVFTFHFSL